MFFELVLIVCALILLVILGLALWFVFQLNLAAMILAMIVVIAVFGLGGWQLGLGALDEDGTTEMVEPVEIKTRLMVGNVQPVSQGGEWSLHFYQNDPRVPGGYFGPPCVPRKRNGRYVIESPSGCKQELANRIKRDPMLLAVMAEEFNLLPDGQSQAAFAREARKESVRRKYQPKIEAVLDSMRNLRFVPLQGAYYTTYVDRAGRVRQLRKQMDPRRHIAMEGRTPDGKLHRIKSDCGFQPTRKAPISGVPFLRRPPEMPPRVVQPLPPAVSPPAVTSPPSPQAAKCRPTGICGTPLSGPEQNDRTSPGSTTGALPQDHAEDVTKQQQPGSGGDLSGVTSTPLGTDTASPQGGAPGQVGADETTGQTGSSSVITAPASPPPNSQPATGDPCNGDPNNCGG